MNAPGMRRGFPQKWKSPHWELKLPYAITIKTLKSFYWSTAYHFIDLMLVALKLPQIEIEAEVYSLLSKFSR